jgi:hypothetical protein
MRRLPSMRQLNQIQSFLLSACTSASTRDVCPVPDEINVCFFAKTIVFDLVFLQTFEANIRSSISCSEGLVVVTVFKSALLSVYYFFLELKTVSSKYELVC